MNPPLGPRGPCGPGGPAEPGVPLPGVPACYMTEEVMQLSLAMW